MDERLSASFGHLNIFLRILTIAAHLIVDLREHCLQYLIINIHRLYVLYLKCLVCSSSLSFVEEYLHCEP